MINRIRFTGRKWLSSLPASIRQLYYHYRVSNLPLFKYLRVSKEVELLSLLPSRPKTIIDIGANHGNWTQGLLNVLQTEATFHLFEPTPTLYHQLKSHFTSYSNIHIYELAVSDKQGTANFYLAESDDLSSLEHLDSPTLGTSSGMKVEVKTDSLDHIHTTLLKGVEIDLLKVDAQGHEEVIISASKDALRHTKAILIEWSIVQPYEIKSNFISVHECLQKQNFQLSYILNQNRFGAQLGWADALYVNTAYLNLA